MFFNIFVTLDFENQNNERITRSVVKISHDDVVVVRKNKGGCVWCSNGEEEKLQKENMKWEERSTKRFVYFMAQFMVWRERRETFSYHRKNSLVQNKYRCTRHISSLTLNSASHFNVVNKFEWRTKLLESWGIFIDYYTLTAFYKSENKVETL